MGKKIVFILLFGLLLRVINIYYSQHINPIADAGSYHNYAVNLVLNNKYTASNNPQKDSVSFFREPLNIYVIASSYKIAQCFGITPSYIIGPKQYHPELWFSRMLYALIGLIGIYFFYLTLKKTFTDKRFILLTIFIITFFYPLFSWEISLLREPLLFSCILALNYYLTCFLKKPKTRYSIFMGLFLGLCTLGLQVFSLFGLFIFIYFCIVFKSKWLFIIKQTSIIAFFTILTITPWLIKVYNFYPNLKIAYSFGNSSTLPIAKCSTLYRKLAYFSIISEQSKNAQLTRLWTMSSHDQFKNTFNGTFTNEADSLIAILKSSPIYSYRNRNNRFFKIYGKAFRKFFVPLHITRSKLKSCSQTSLIFNCIIICFELFLSFLGIIGIIKHFKKYWKFLFVFWGMLVILLLLPSYGTENRRFVILWYMYIPFALITIKSFLNKRKIAIK